MKILEAINNGISCPYMCVQEPLAILAEALDQRKLRSDCEDGIIMTETDKKKQSPYTLRKGD